MGAESSGKKEFGVGILRGNLLWLVVCQCIWMFTTNIPRPYLPLYIQNLGGSPSDIGVVNSVSAIAGLFLYPLGGYIADRVGRVKIVGLATFLYAFTFIPFAYAPNWQTLAAASFLQNLVLFYSPILTVIQADSMPAGMRSQGFAIAMSVPGALGIISPFIGGYLVDSMGIMQAMYTTYLVGFGAGLLVAFIRWYMLKETLTTKAEPLNYGDIPGLLRDSYASFIETLRWMPEPIKVLAVMQILKTFFTGIAGSFWIVYATTVIGLTATDWGSTSALSGLTRLLVSVPAGKLLDKLGRRRLLLSALVLTPLLPICFLFVQNTFHLALLVVSMALVNAFLMPGFQSLLADYTPRERRGRVTSAVGGGMFFVDIRGSGMSSGMLLFVPAAIAQVLGGALYEWNPVVPFYVMAGGLVLVTIWAYFKVRDPKTLYA